MTERTLNWGEDADDATYQTIIDQDDSGNAIPLRDDDGNVDLLEYDGSGWVVRSDVDLDGGDLSNVGEVTATDADLGALVSDLDAGGNDLSNIGSVTTKKINNTREVPQFGTLQDAHNDLPSGGGKIVVTEDVTETGVTISKRVTIESKHANSTSEHESAIEIDTSGGDGLDIQTGTVELRDVAIKVDNTGGYGIRCQPGDARPRVVMDNVVVRNKGAHGIILRGQLQQCRLDAWSYNNSGKGWYIDVTTNGNYFNANTVHRMVASENGQEGVHIRGGPLAGNQIQSLLLENNTGTAFLIDGTPTMEGNIITGYGAENDADVDISPGSGHSNILQLRGGNDKVDHSFFSIVSINGVDSVHANKLAKLRKDTAQSISSNTVEQVAWEVEDVDELGGGGAASTSNDWIKVPHDGTYHVEAKVRHSGSGDATSGDSCLLYIFVNSIKITSLNYERPGNYQTSPIISDTLSLSAGDEVKIQFKNNNNSDGLASGSVSQYFSVTEA